MFEFLFKRSGDKPDAAPARQTGQGLSGPGPVDPPAPGQQEPQRAEQAGKIAALAGDEAVAADFILACDYSELRLAAAEFIHSREHLERVHAGIRNTDRRVAKLMQSRLDAIRHQEPELARCRA